MANLNAIRRGIKPDLSASDVNRLLWCCTPYPFGGDLRKLRRGLRVYLRRGGGTVDGAITVAHQELDDAWERHKRSMDE